MKKSTVYSLALLFGVIYLMVIVNLYFLQFSYLAKAQRLQQNKDVTQALFYWGQCLRSKAPFSPITKKCQDAAARALVDRPEFTNYIEGYYSATNHFNEKSPMLTFLLHFSFVVFLTFLLIGILRTSLKKKATIVCFTFSVLNFLLWLICAYEIK